MRNRLVALISLVLWAHGSMAQLTFCGRADNDLYRFLVKKGFVHGRYENAEMAVGHAAAGSGILIIAGSYPAAGITISPQLLEAASARGLRLYIEYASSIPGLTIDPIPYAARLERGVITGSSWKGRPATMSLLGINDCHVLPVHVTDPLIVFAKVAGFNKAEFGIDDVESYSLLFRKDNMMVATTALSQFATGRYEPVASWQQVWEHILSWLMDKQDLHTGVLPAYVHPMYGRGTLLPADARRTAVTRGVDWFYKGRLLIHPLWKDSIDKYLGDFTHPFGPPIDPALPPGDGSLGILEGHASNIYYDGTQQYRYWIRGDVQGEGAYALASAGWLLRKPAYTRAASRLADFIFSGSGLRAGARGNKDSAAFGLIGWSTNHPDLFYGDDNARAILGLIGASAYTGRRKWDREIVEAILANFRTTGREGFRGDNLVEKDLQSAGWKHFWDSSIVSPHPHYESWMWACYLWLYEQTKYAPLLEKTRNAIRLTMEAYPDKWLWTNGIQQERARMILPLAWLVRIENTEEHRHWLDEVVAKLLESQQPCGAIREELGGEGTGRYGSFTANKQYGLNEAPLIFRNGDEVADMLYTSNFAFFSLNEAARATGNKKYRDAVSKLSDFLIRIQVKSDKHSDIDGAWFRAFDYGRWDYWASNADAGWGAWCTLAGWIQTWIVATQVLVEQKTSYWETSRPAGIGAKKHMPLVIHEMFGSDAAGRWQK